MDGVYEGSWKNEAQISFIGYAFIDSTMRVGGGVLRLQKGETVEQILMIN
jgi:hypothetical protein